MIKKWVDKKVAALFEEWAEKQSLKVDNDIRVWKQAESARADDFRAAHLRHGEQIELGLGVLVKLVSNLTDKS